MIGNKVIALLEAGATLRSDKGFVDLYDIFQMTMVQLKTERKLALKFIKEFEDDEDEIESLRISRLFLDVIENRIEVKNKEVEQAKQAKLDAERKQKLLEALGAKEQERIGTMTEAEIRAELAKL